MTEATGIHAHPSYKIGVRPNDQSKPRIQFADIRDSLASIISGPVVPTVVDDTKGVTFGLDNNDQFGVCVPTGFDNFKRAVSYILTGNQVTATWAQIMLWYKEQNPDFDPVSHVGDEGMNIQDFLAARVKSRDIVAFASVQTDSDEELREAMWLGLGLIIAVDLQVAQQDQTSAHPPVWEYKKSDQWGGHCVLQIAYHEDDEDAITWAKRVSMTPGFVANQRTEAWFVITQDHLDHPGFREGINIDKLRAEFKRLTGRSLPGRTPSPEPRPSPAPVPTDEETDANLWALSEDWVLNHRHSGEAHEAATALHQWALAKGLLR